MKIAIFFVTVSLIIFSCKDKTKYDYQVVDSDIIVSMNEELGSPTRSFKLTFNTDKAYPCINYSMITNSEISDNKIKIEFLGIYTPNICLTAIGPASSTIPIPGIQNKTYDIEFKIGTNISKGMLVCSSDDFQFHMQSLLQIKFNKPILKRVPNDLIWGTAGYHTSSTINKVNEFLDSLKIIGATDIILENGNYNYFEIENNKIKQPTNSGYWFAKSFVYRFTGDKNRVRSLVKNYGKSFGDLISISAYGDLGEEYLGWILKNQ